MGKRQGDRQTPVRGRPLSCARARGSSVHPREVVKEALRRNAAACILVHNYPARYPTGIAGHA
ncbi:MAG: JAB domain-containing protein [Acidobacteriaceae bacterium]